MRTSTKLLLGGTVVYWAGFVAMQYDVATFSRYDLLQYNVEFALTAILTVLYFIYREVESYDM